MTLIKKFLLFVAIAFPASLAFIQAVKPYNPHSLYGFFDTGKPPVFRLDSFAKGTYQEKRITWQNTQFGYRNYFVRLYNQVDYSLFGIAHAERIVVGKKNCLFAMNYVNAYLGRGFKGKRYIDAKVRQMKILQDALWKEHRIYLYPVFAADKGSFYAEYLPERLLRTPKTLSNYEYTVEQCAKQGVRFFDGNRYLLDLKDTSRYPLYPMTGIHWSEYGAVLVADTMFRSLQGITGIPIPGIRIRDLRVTKNMLFGDDDILLTMNLLCDVDHPAGAYPRLAFDWDSSQTKPKALFIGDSFFWMWYNIGIIHHLFGNVEFWYYDKEVFPNCFAKPKFTDEVDLRTAVLRQQFIILVQTNGGGGDFGSGFLDRAYAEFDPSPENPIRTIEERIWKSRGWLKEEVRKSEEKKLPVRQIIRNDAIYLYNQGLMKE